MINHTAEVFSDEWNTKAAKDLAVKVSRIMTGFDLMTIRTFVRVTEKLSLTILLELAFCAFPVAMAE